MQSPGLAVVAVLALWLGCGDTSAAARKPKAQILSEVGQGADSLREEGPARFLTLRDIQSRIRATPQKFVLLHLWATWCQPCIEELGTMSELARTLPGRGIDLFSLAMDNPTRSSATRVSRVIDKRAGGLLTRAIAQFENADAFIEGIDPRWEGSIPALMAYLPSGKLVGAVYGQATRREIEHFVESLFTQARGQ